jgi:hypothetical protein
VIPSVARDVLAWPRGLRAEGVDWDRLAVRVQHVVAWGYFGRMAALLEALCLAASNNPHLAERLRPLVVMVQDAGRDQFEGLERFLAVRPDCRQRLQDIANARSGDRVLRQFDKRVLQALLDKGLVESSGSLRIRYHVSVVGRIMLAGYWARD